MRCSIPSRVLAAILLLPIAGAQNSWLDPSTHSVQFVTVEDGVRLEVLD